jgi:hypothetical protein
MAQIHRRGSIVDCRWPLFGGKRSRSGGHTVTTARGLCCAWGPCAQPAGRGGTEGLQRELGAPTWSGRRLPQSSASKQRLNGGGDGNGAGEQEGPGWDLGGEWGGVGGAGWDGGNYGAATGGQMAGRLSWRADGLAGGWQGGQHLGAKNLKRMQKNLNSKNQIPRSLKLTSKLYSLNPKPKISF